MPVISEQLKPIDTVNGFQIRPGFFREFGAVAIPGGVNFTIHTHGATSCELLLFHRKAEEPYAVIPFPESYKIGFCYSMIVFDLDIEEFEYAYRLDGPYDEKKGLRFDKNKILLDPYARAVTGQSQWGHVNNAQHGYRARVVQSNFDWGDQRHHSIPMEDLIIYELHVRGFTMDESSGVKHHGTFEGLREKIPYLKELGVNAVELMPIFEFDEMRDVRLIDENELIEMLLDNPTAIDSDKEEDERRTFGDKLADKVTQIAGSWGFIIGFCVFLILWMIINTILIVRFDEYPFILLNLILSCIAALQAPVIMMSQNRAAKKDSLRSLNDYKTDLKSELILEVLHEQIKDIQISQKKILKLLEEKDVK